MTIVRASSPAILLLYLSIVQSSGLLLAQCRIYFNEGPGEQTDQLLIYISTVQWTTFRCIYCTIQYTFSSSTRLPLDHKTVHLPLPVSGLPIIISCTICGRPAAAALLHKCDQREMRVRFPPYHAHSRWYLIKSSHQPVLQSYSLFSYVEINRWCPASKNKKKCLEWLSQPCSQRKLAYVT